ncbi:MAG: sensor histidine kinase [Bacteroidota bacterium]
MKLKLTFVFFCFTLISFSQSRSAIIDSLKQVVKTTTNDTVKASAYGRLAWLNISTDIDMAKAYVDSSRSLFKAIKHEKGIAISNYRQAVMHRVSGNYKEALEAMQAYMNYVESVQDTLNIANGFYQKGAIYSLQGNYQESLEQYFNTLNLYETLGDSTGIGFTLNSIGIVYKNLKKYPEAIESYEKALAIHEERNDLNDLANVYNGLGSVYVEQGEPDKALGYFLKTLAIDKQINNNWGTAKVSKNIALIYMDKKDYLKAEEFLQNAYKIQQDYNYDSELAETLTQLSTLYRLTGDVKQSESYLNQAFSHRVPNKKVYQDLHLQSYNFYNALGDYKKALQHYESYTTYKDSIFNEDNLKNINALEFQFETEKKDKAILQQKLQLEQSDNTLQKKRTQYNYMTAIAIFFLLSALLTWFIYQQRQKRKDQEILTLKREHQIKTLETLIEGEEKERLRIAKELHDGVNGDLSAIKFKLVSLQEMNNKVIDEAVEMIDKSCQQVRAISHNLIPPTLESFSLVEATEMFCQNLNSIHKPKIEFQFIGDDIVLGKKAEVNIFRIIQELVANSIKHAEASEINVQISHRGNSIFISVEDNGKGFDVKAIKQEGIGLKNIRSRVEFLNGELDIMSNEQGSSFTVEIDTTQID